jgi:parallel beta-helix repeat protein
MKKTAVLVLILISLMTLGVACIRPIRAQYQGGITIYGDGSINPSIAPIKQTGNTYTLTSDVNGSIAVERSNIIFDGNGHTIAGIIQIGSLPTAPTVGISYTSNVTVENFTVTGSYYGISLWQTSNVTVVNNTITGTGNGILSMDEPTAGIDVEGGGSNIITGNNLVNNYHGMSFLESINNLIIGNNITNSSNPYANFGLIGCGIMFWGASNNTIYHNNFINNDQQALDDSFASPFSVNIWDDGYHSGGNYWSNYLTKYSNVTEIGSSGIGSTPYVIDSQNKDRYPLMEPFMTTPPKIAVLSPLNQTYNESSVPLVFTVDKFANWTGYSLDGQQNVTITGNSTIANMTNGFHSITVYSNGTFGNMGASETVSFTIAKPESFPTTLIATASGASVAIIGIGLLIYFRKRNNKRK